MRIIEKKSDTLWLVLLATMVCIYLIYINVNLPFMTYDELQGSFYTLSEQISVNINFGRISHFPALFINKLISFPIPSLFGGMKRALTGIILFFVLCLYLFNKGFSLKLSAIISSFIILFHQLDWQHNGLISFYGGYNLYISLFLVSIMICEFYGRNNNLSHVKSVGVVVLLLLSYSSEVFLGLSVVYIFTAMLAGRGKDALPFIFSVITYIAIYIVMQGFTLAEKSDYMSDYLVGSIGMYDYVDMFNGALLYNINSISYFNKLGLSNSISVILSLFIVSVLLALFFHKSKEIITRDGKAYFLSWVHDSHILVWGVLFIAPGFLMSLQPMKLSWILNEQSERYVFSFYSWVSFCFLVVFLSKWEKASKASVFKIITIVLVFMSIKSNYEFVNEYKYSMENWNSIKSIVNKSERGSTIKIDEKYLVHPNISVLGRDTLSKLIETNYDMKVAICYRSDLYILSESKRVQLEGFAEPESFGRWTVGGVSTIKIPVNVNVGDNIIIQVDRVFGNNIGQKISFTLNNDTKEVVAKDGDLISITVREEINNPVVTIKIPHPTKPKSIGFGEDIRDLGIMISSVRIKKYNVHTPMYNCTHY